MILKSDALQLVVTETAISGQKRPSVIADKREPPIVRGPALEKFQVPMYFNCGIGQHFEYGLTVTKVFIKVNVELRTSCSPT